MINKGLENEIQIIKEIDMHRIKRMNPAMQKLLNYIYPKINQYKIFKAEKCDTYDKADMKIIYDNNATYVSIKTSTSKCVQMCYVKNFINFLKRYNVSNRTLKILLLYHYGDGTLNGTGTTRDDYNSLMVKMKNYIQDANKELNSNKNLVRGFVKMCLFDGIHPECCKADYLYVGNTEYGSICSKTDIDNFILVKSFSYIKNIHIGPIIIHPYARYTDFKNTNENKRHMIECEWHNLQRDVEYMSNGFKK